MLNDLMLKTMEPYDVFRWAVELFDDRDYLGAAQALEHLISTHDVESDLGEARELLARSYYHSAQLGRAEKAARELLERHPDHPYAPVLLARALDRQSRPEEAATVRRMADALGIDC